MASVYIVKYNKCLYIDIRPTTDYGFYGFVVWQNLNECTN